MQSLSVCWCFRLVLLIPGVWGALTACQATGRVSIGDFTPLLLSSMLSARAAREPRRIYRRIGYWHAPQDQGRSIPHWGRGQGSYFWGVRRRPRLDRCWRTYGNANWPSGHAQPSVLGVFEDSKPAQFQRRPHTEIICCSKDPSEGDCQFPYVQPAEAAHQDFFEPMLAARRHCRRG